MATATPPDDIASLMTRVQLDRSQYKVFNSRKGNQSESETEARPAFHAVQRSHSHARVPAASSPLPVQETTARPRWSVLSSLMGSPEHSQPAVEPEALLVPMLTFSASSGGTGKSTILSTVSRVLSGMGESNFLVYAESQRTLPLHFGGHQVVPGRVRTFVPPVRENGQLHFYVHSETSGQMPEEAHAWLPRQVNQMASEVGRVLCEISNGEMDETQILGLASINLRILVPDISSVLTVSRDLAAQKQTAESVQTYYLLNMYDHSLAFHRDVRERLSASLGSRLLPFTIRRTDLISEALGAGVTVVDYDPKAGVVEDFKWLAQWVRNSMPHHEVEPIRALI